MNKRSRSKTFKKLILGIIFITILRLFFVSIPQIPNTLPLMKNNFKINEICEKSNSLNETDKIAMKFLKGRQGIIECDILNTSQFVRITHRENEFMLKLNLLQLLKQTKQKESKIKCRAELFDKQMNVSERFSNIFYESKNFNKKQNYTLSFTKHGYYYVHCFKSANSSIKIYEDSYLVLPKNMSKLVEERREMQKLEIKGNNLTYEADNDDQYLKFLDSDNTLLLEKKMNVLMLGFDSLSYQHFQRVMPITFKYLSKSLENNVMFTSMNRVGENTHPNILAMLSGIFITDIPSLNVTSEFSIYKKIDDEFYDKYPLMWYRYEKSGYLTGFQVKY